MPWKKLLAWATGQIDEALRQKLEFDLEENRVYRALLDRHSPRWRLHDAERKVLAEKGKPLGKLLGEVITIVNPKPCSNGTAAWSPANGIFPADAPPNRDDRSSRPRLNSGCSSSPARFQPGAMIASSAHWPIRGIESPTRPWVIFSS